MLLPFLSLRIFAFLFRSTGSSRGLKLNTICCPILKWHWFQDWEEVARVREKLNQMLLEDAVGFVVRSRFHQNAEEEKASLFHAGREFKNSKIKITSLTSLGQILTDP